MQYFKSFTLRYKHPHEDIETSTTFSGVFWTIDWSVFEYEINGCLSGSPDLPVIRFLSWGVYHPLSDKAGTQHDQLGHWSVHTLMYLHYKLLDWSHLGHVGDKSADRKPQLWQVLCTVRLLCVPTTCISFLYERTFCQGNIQSTSGTPFPCTCVGLPVKPTSDRFIKL